MSQFVGMQFALISQPTWLKVVELDVGVVISVILIVVKCGVSHFRGESDFVYPISLSEAMAEFPIKPMASASPQRLDKPNASLAQPPTVRAMCSSLRNGRHSNKLRFPGCRLYCLFFLHCSSSFRHIPEGRCSVVMETL